jgi:hypothetical protein
MTLQGKGFFIWKIPSCENGVAANIATQAANAHFSHVLVKIADGTAYSNYDSSTSTDYVPAVISALRAKGIETWGWQYVYGSDPTKEAKVGGARAKALGVNGFVIDAESQFEKSGMSSVAKTYLVELRKAIPALPVALSTFRYPSYHATFPFSTFFSYCDLNMPQVYWEGAHNADEQLLKSLQEYQNLAPTKPYIPTGPAYKVGSWSPTTTDLSKFLSTAKTKNLPGVNFFSWDECRRDLSADWNYIRDYSWPPALKFQDQFIDALNSHDPSKVAALYASTAVQITPTRTIQGTEAIKTWYNTLFNQMMPNSAFTLTGSSTTGKTYHISWMASSTSGSVKNGTDTFGVIDNKITYHYSFFTIT